MSAVPVKCSLCWETVEGRPVEVRRPGEHDTTITRWYHPKCLDDALARGVGDGQP